MKQVDEMPTSGQFVAVWEYDGVIWSEVYINQGEYIDIYSADDDDFHRVPSHQVVSHHDKYKAKYFIAE